MDKNTFPEVTTSQLGSTYRLLDLKDLIYKQPGDTDILQSRTEYGSDDERQSMKTSILARGVLEPIAVIPLPDGTFRVTEGNRRTLSLNELIAEGHTATDTGQALSKIRCEVKPSIASTTDSIYNDWLSLNESAEEDVKTACRAYVEKQVKLGLGQEALIRNTQRLNWSPIEVATQIQLQLDAGVDKDFLCKQFGIAEKTLNERLRLLSKKEEIPLVLEAVEQGKAGWTTARLLSNVKDELVRKEILTKVTSPEEGEKALSSKEVKTLIDEKHQASIASGGEGIKAQDRKKRAPRPPKGLKKELRGAEALLATIQEVATLRSELSADEDDELSINSALDLEIALKTLQWVVNPKDIRPLTEVIIGLEVH